MPFTSHTAAGRFRDLPTLPELPAEELRGIWQKAFFRGYWQNAGFFPFALAMIAVRYFEPDAGMLSLIFSLVALIQIAVAGMWLGMGRAPIWLKLGSVVVMTLGVAYVLDPRDGHRVFLGLLLTAFAFALPGSIARVLGMRCELRLRNRRVICADRAGKPYGLAALATVAIAIAAITAATGILKPLKGPTASGSLTWFVQAAIGLVVTASAWAVLSDKKRNIAMVGTLTLPLMSAVGLVAFNDPKFPGASIAIGASVIGVILVVAIGLIRWANGRGAKADAAMSQAFAIICTADLLSGCFIGPGIFFALIVLVVQTIAAVFLMPFQIAGFRLTSADVSSEVPTAAVESTS